MEAVILKSKQYFTILLLLLYLGSNTCRLGEQENSLKNLTNLIVKPLLTGSVICILIIFISVIVILVHQVCFYYLSFS